MMKLLAIFCFAFLISNVFGQVPPYNETCESGKYPPDPKNNVTTYVVDLDLPPEQRWVEISLKYKEPLQVLVAYIKTFILEFSPKLKALIELVDNDLGVLTKTFPAPYGDEIRGIANATDIPLGDVVLYNIFYEIFTLCTSIVGQDPQGNTYHARNLDFGLFLGWDLHNDTWIISELLRPVIINVDYVKSGQLQYRTVTFVGFVGLITGVRPGVLSLTINERYGVNGGYIGLFEWILDINRKQSFITFLARDVVENALDFESAVKALADTPLLAPCYYIVGGPKANQAAVVTRDRANAVDIWRLGQNATQWFLVETNYDHWKAPLFIDDRVTPANRCMNKLGQSSLSFEGLFNVLSSKPVLNKLTVYTALIELQTGRLESYIQYCGNPCWPF